MTYIQTWQRRIGVTPDGAFGPATLAASLALADAAGPPSRPADFLERVKVPPQPPGYALACARQSTMLELLGKPGALSENCSEPFPVFAKRLTWGAQVHSRFKVSGLKPAVEAVKRALDACRAGKPALYALLGTAGMLCVRKVRGGQNFSNHSWGCAIDISIGGQIDSRGDGSCQRGLLLLEPFFRAEGFFWGAWFPTEDAMHFEASDGLVREWQAKRIL